VFALVKDSNNLPSITVVSSLNAQVAPTNSIDTQVAPFDYVITQLIPNNFTSPHTNNESITPSSSLIAPISDI
jgi:hypothetical protein